MADKLSPTRHVSGKTEAAVAEEAAVADAVDGKPLKSPKSFELA